MKNNTISNILQVLTAVAIVGLFSVAKHADAQTYFVDLTGNGCNASCQQLLQQYLSNTNNSTNNSTNNGTTGTSTATTTGTGTSNYVAYPYQQYTYFPSTTQYYAQNAQYSTASGTYNPYAYRTYQYFQNPNQNTGSSMNGYNGYGNGYNSYSYPSQVYTYYGSAGSSTKSQSAPVGQPVGQIVTQPATGVRITTTTYPTSAGYNSNQPGGFTMTGGY